MLTAVRDYTAGAKLFHWITVALIFSLFPLAWVMGDYDGLFKFKLYNWHKSLGITLLVVMVLRLVWRFAYPPPALPQQTPRLERTAAHAGHLGLYALLFLMPLSGWAMISASPFPSRLFPGASGAGWSFPLIPWIADLTADQKKALEANLVIAHGFISYLLLALIAIHIVAALRHGLILKDGVMSRIFPKFKKTADVTVTTLVVLAGIGFSGLQGSAKAAEWGIQPDKSRVTFEATGSGYTARGTIKVAQSEVMFEPDAPQQATARIKLDMSSVSTGTKDVDVTLKTDEYFNPTKFPFADFTANGAKQSGEGKFVFDGKLTLKGVTKPVSVPFTLAVSNGVATVKGETKINRLDFGVGAETVAGMVIDKDVKLIIELTALKLDN